MSEDAAAAVAGTSESAGQAESSQRESGQPELDLGVVSTGLSAVDIALAPLETLPDRPVDEHPDVYEQVLTALASTMSPQPATADPAATSAVDGNAVPAPPGADGADTPG